MSLWPVVLIAGIIAILFAAYLAQDVLKRDKGTPAMQEVAGMFFEGVLVFLFCLFCFFVFSVVFFLVFCFFVFVFIQ